MKPIRRYALHAWMLGAGITSQGALAEQRLEAELTTPYASDSQRSAIVTLTLRNTGDEPVTIMKWDTPFVESGGRLPKSQFEVRTSAGEVVRYVGRSVNIGRLLSSYFIVLQSGQALKKDLDLSHEYDLGQGGAFSVKFTLSLDREPDRYVVSAKEFNDFKRNSLKKVESNEAVIYLSSPVAPTAVLDDDDCDAAKKDVIWKA